MTAYRGLRGATVRRDPRLASPGQLGAVGGVVLACALFLSPFLTWRPIPDVLFTASDALFGVAALLLLAGGSINLRPFRDLTAIWMIGLLAMLMGLFVSSMLNGDPTRWLIVASQYLAAYAVLPLLIVQRDTEASARIARPLLFGVLAMEAFAVAVYFITDGSRDATMWLAHEFITGVHRLGAFMADANWNAAMIAMTLPFLLYLSRTRHIGPIITYAGLAILSIALLLSGSFSGFTSALGAVFVFMAVAGGRQGMKVVAVLLVAIVAAFLLGFTLPAVFQLRVGGALETGDLSHAGTFLGRWDLVKEAWGIVNDTAWLGLGADRYRIVSADAAPVHNTALLIWAEGGLVAVLGWLLMMLAPVIAAIRAYRHDRAAAALGLSVSLAFLAVAMASPHLYARSFVVPLLLAMGVTLSAANVSDSRAWRLGATPFGGSVRRKRMPERPREGVV